MVALSLGDRQGIRNSTARLTQNVRKTPRSGVTVEVPPTGAFWPGRPTFQKHLFTAIIGLVPSDDGLIEQFPTQSVCMVVEDLLLALLEPLLEGIIEFLLVVVCESLLEAVIELGRPRGEPILALGLLSSMRRSEDSSGPAA